MQQGGGASSHGAPLGKDSLEGVKTKFGFNPEESFVVDDSVYSYYKGHAAHGAAAESAWQTRWASYAEKHPAAAKDLERRFRRATRRLEKRSAHLHAGSRQEGHSQHLESVLNACATVLSELMGGSADLTPSNLTNLKCSSDFQGATPEGRYIRFGVREHGMAAICNGMFAHGGMRPYCATL